MNVDEADAAAARVRSGWAEQERREAEHRSLVAERDRYREALGEILTRSWTARIKGIAREALGWRP